jgi:hypothetical protein
VSAVSIRGVPSTFTSGPVRDSADCPLKWQRLRRSLADLYRRAEVSQAANSRYLEALASGTIPLFQEAQSVCQALIVKGQKNEILIPLYYKIKERKKEKPTVFAFFLNL